MDTCPICGVEFPRHWRNKGVRQVYCSKACRYRAWFFEKTCPTCGKTFRTNKLSTRQDYCSLACIQRSPCQLCGKIITGRATFQGGEKRFCSRKCANIVNRTMASKTKYVVFGFAWTIKRTGRLACEQCGQDNPARLVVHHRDRDRKNNAGENLETLCANCHAALHWSDSVHRTADVAVARIIADRL